MLKLFVLKVVLNVANSEKNRSGRFFKLFFNEKFIQIFFFTTFLHYVIKKIIKTKNAFSMYILACL